MNKDYSKAFDPTTLRKRVSELEAALESEREARQQAENGEAVADDLYDRERVAHQQTMDNYKIVYSQVQALRVAATSVELRHERDAALAAERAAHAATRAETERMNDQVCPECGFLSAHRFDCAIGLAAAGRQFEPPQPEPTDDGDADPARDRTDPESQVYWQGMK